MIKAIETKYLGYRFRSRLEARWASFLYGYMAFQYEPEGFETSSGRYLPDFFIPGIGDVIHDSFIEIKPINWSPSIDKAYECLTEISTCLNKRVFILAGDPMEFSLLFHFPEVGKWLVFNEEDDDMMCVHFLELLFNAKLIAGSLCFRECIPFEYIISDARAARSARFEHGEAPR